MSAGQQFLHDSRVSETDEIKLWWKKWAIMADVEPDVFPMQFSEMNVKTNITDKTGFVEIVWDFGMKFCSIETFFSYFQVQIKINTSIHHGFKEKKTFFEAVISLFSLLAVSQPSTVTHTYTSSLQSLSGDHWPCQGSFKIYPGYISPPMTSCHALMLLSQESSFVIGRCHFILRCIFISSDTFSCGSEGRSLNSSVC